MIPNYKASCSKFMLHMNETQLEYVLLRTQRVCPWCNHLMCCTFTTHSLKNEEELSCLTCRVKFKFFGWGGRHHSPGYRLEDLRYHDMQVCWHNEMQTLAMRKTHWQPKKFISIQKLNMSDAQTLLNRLNVLSMLYR